MRKSKVLAAQRFLLAALLSAPTAHALDDCANKPPAWVFCSGFEEGNKSIWDDYDGNPDSTNVLMPDPGPVGRPNNRVMRMRVPPGRGTADVIKVLPQQYDKLYARWYMKWEPGFDFSALNHGSGLHAGSRDYLGRSNFRPSGSDWFSAWLEPNLSQRKFQAYSYYRGMDQDCSDPNGSCWGDLIPCLRATCEKPQHAPKNPPPTLQAGQWYCVEMMMDGGTPTTSPAGANGTLNFWVDNAEIGPWNDLWLRTTSSLKISILWLSLFHHGNHSVEGAMFDDVVVSTQRIGCQGADTDSKAPGSPHGLRTR